jgi:hypothetical protein
VAGSGVRNPETGLPAPHTKMKTREDNSRALTAQKNTRALSALLAPERSFQPAKLVLDQDTVPGALLAGQDKPMRANGTCSRGI